MAAAVTPPLSAIASAAASHPNVTPRNQPAAAPIVPALRQHPLPLAFVPNAGQTDAAVRFLVRGLGGTLFFTPGEFVLGASTLRIA